MTKQILTVLAFTGVLLAQDTPQPTPQSRIRQIPRRPQRQEQKAFPDGVLGGFGWDTNRVYVIHEVNNGITNTVVVMEYKGKTHKHYLD